MVGKDYGHPLSIQDIISVLDLTIKKDKINKIITFLCQLSAYSEDSQFNISFNSPSSTGKTYIPMQIAQLFPQEDVMKIDYCSPTAFFHDRGECDEENNVTRLDLSRKIIIFTDQPHTSLLQRLRPLLSHDQKEMTLKITDKAKRSNLRTKNILIKGFPSVIFCSAGLKLDEQEATRMLLLSPEVQQEKIRESLKLKIKKEINNSDYKSEIEKDEGRVMLKNRIRSIKKARITEIRVRSADKIRDLFENNGSKLQPRCTRDVSRIFSLAKSLALLNYQIRSKDSGTIEATDNDVEQALDLWSNINKSQSFNIPPYVYNIYKDVIEPLWTYEREDNAHEIIGFNEITRLEIRKSHFQIYGRTLPDWQLRREILPMLEEAGLIVQEPDVNDRRQMIIKSPENKTD
jgi:hypothetical protein